MVGKCPLLSRSGVRISPGAPFLIGVFRSHGLHLIRETSGDQIALLSLEGSHWVNHAQR